MSDNVLSEKSKKTEDEKLIRSAVGGSRDALDELVRRHQDWIFNIALRMVFDPEDAKDVAQEVLIKIVTKLSTFQGRSSFRTWVYRITANHVINMRKRKAEKKIVSFSQYWKAIDRTPDEEFPDTSNLPVDVQVILDEIKIHCLTALLLCLNRKNRLAFILGEIFGLSDAAASEIMEISRESFRQRLSRSRKKVFGFVQEKCGLINAGNPCHCNKKAKAMMDSGNINPEKLEYKTGYVYTVGSIVEEKYKYLNDYLDRECRKLFRDQPFRENADLVEPVKQMIDSGEFKELFDF